MKKLKEILFKSKIDGYLVFLFFSITTFSFLYFTGTLNSGYHLIDDHGILAISNSIKETSYWETLVSFVQNDFNIRFRPLYYPYYITVIKIFGPNFIALSVFGGVFASFIFSFFYFALRKMSYSVLESFIFVFFVFLGHQSAIWWRLGTNEPIGMFFFGLSFLFLAKGFNEKDNVKNNILFTVFLILSSLCKESFIVVIPALVLFKLLMEKKLFIISLKESIKRNWLPLLSLPIMFIELAIIKFAVGTNKIGYAGVPSTYLEFFEGIKNILLSKESLLYLIVLVIILLIIFFISFIFTSKERGKNLLSVTKSLFPTICFALLIILPNIAMHAKSGMVERYLVPTTIGFALLSVGLIKNVKQLILKIIMIIFSFSFLVLFFNNAKVDADNFALEGKKTKVLFSQIKENLDVDSKILLVVDPVDRFEVSYSIKTYLEFFKFTNMYGYPIMREYSSDFENSLKEGWFSWFEGKMLVDMQDMPDAIIIFDTHQEESFFNGNPSLSGKYINVLEENPSSLLYILK